ncbi:MAG: ABC transporter, partial [Planctomycetes bacterium]|nr:ABC transporter [Planctomycetota bacterium]
MGIWTSSLTENQITAFIIGVSLMFGLVLVGLDPLVVGLPPTLGTIAARLGVLSHFANIGRGVIDLRDVVYFATMAAAFIALAYLSLMRRK